MRLQNRECQDTELSPFLASPPRCPRCGDRMVAPELSEFVDRGEIRHHWLCDTCGQAFETSVRLCCNEAA